MKFKEVPPNKEFYWNPRKDEIPSITVKASKVPEFPSLYTTYSGEISGLDDLEMVNAIGHDEEHGHFSFYSIKDDDEVELVDVPTQFKDIAVGVYFYRWDSPVHLFMKVEDAHVMGSNQTMRNAVVVDLQHHSKEKLFYFKPDEYVKLWDEQVW